MEPRFLPEGLVVGDALFGRVVFRKCKAVREDLVHHAVPEPLRGLKIRCIHRKPESFGGEIQHAAAVTAFIRTEPDFSQRCTETEGIPECNRLFRRLIDCGKTFFIGDHCIFFRPGIAFHDQSRVKDHSGFAANGKTHVSSAGNRTARSPACAVKCVMLEGNLIQTFSADQFEIQFIILPRGVIEAEVFAHGAVNQALHHISVMEE